MSAKTIRFATLSAVILITGNSLAADPQKGLAAYEAKNYAAAFSEWDQLAVQGNAVAQNGLGILYYNGYGVSQDYKFAIKWFGKAAEQGNATAQNNLALMYYKGQGVSQNYVTAASWLRRAAEQGNATAQNGLGLMYENGEGVFQNYKNATYWYMRSAEQGNSDGQFFLGLMYGSGRGVLQDYVYAYMWLNLAAWSTKDVATLPFAEQAKEQMLERMTSTQIEQAQKLARKCMRNDFRNCTDMPRLVSQK